MDDTTGRDDLGRLGLGRIKCKCAVSIGMGLLFGLGVYIYIFNVTDEMRTNNARTQGCLNLMPIVRMYSA